MGAEVVDDHDVARLEGRGEHLLDVGEEPTSIDWPGRPVRRKMQYNLTIRRV